MPINLGQILVKELRSSYWKFVAFMLQAYIIIMHNID
jgi:hypothetical protein